MVKYNCIAGIDYGAKKAGTTAIAILIENKVKIFQSAKNQDADVFLESYINQYNIQLIGFDAPLSLPGVYINPQEYSDYFYRKCDREVNAMSPMFLGGLTARAMALHAKHRDTKIIETYPAKIALEFGLTDLAYKKRNEDISSCIAKLLANVRWELENDIRNWHAFDSLLALYGAVKYSIGTAKAIGDAEEGLIYF